MNGSNGSTSFDDSSINNFTVTTNGDAQTSTSDRSSGGNSLGGFAIRSDAVLDEIDNFFSVCDIAEILIYNRAISTEERQQIENYLNNKYAIYKLNQSVI